MQAQSIVFFSCNSPDSQAFFSKHFPHCAQYPHDVQDYRKENLGDRDKVLIVSAFTGSTWDQEHIDWFPNLQYIVNRSTGYDNIDLEYCRSKGIKVYNVPDYGSATVAEHTFALIMAASRKVYPSAQMVKQDKNFESRGQQSTRGFDLHGKTIGVIGAGNIGRHTIAIAHGFGMNIVVSDHHPDQEFGERYSITWAKSLEELVSVSDIISLHVPYCPGTHHLIGEHLTDSFKPGSILINTSRGETVDTRVLLSLLQQGVLSFAGIDVLEDEHEFGSGTETQMQQLNQQLLQLDNVLVTPHNAFNTQEAIERIWQTTRENINAIHEGVIDSPNRVL